MPSCFGSFRRKSKVAKDNSEKDLPNARHLRPPKEIRTSFRELDFSGSFSSGSFSSASSENKPYMLPSACPSPCTTTTDLALQTSIIDNASLEQKDAHVTNGNHLEVPVASRPGSSRSINARDDAALFSSLNITQPIVVSELPQPMINIRSSIKKTNVVHVEDITNDNSITVG